ncbi:hypothetical protein TVAG_316350 [Trichomonas vaginalis G3]|uniref:Uncharacterized protein n=1 Tax=Trichomonas vaginalis (strain ATCC PRA-98 / G3) TaxID=412133 RepID=A2FR95_TRIV3|nr:metallo-dependent phosphatases family [Trichomonas vaginalis G3]EAX92571.1 hypothetical protein TVAG_316350 [Trichomonas vaginalis G3]KAI5504423.1 metallo-dependent phosphatases family [Trichomonas vaginalis G3]|eukprot:XP_001305501.1 hypothetical protein [Trichomonas vaginalis G3]
MLIRAHECVAEGICKNFDDKVITVFTASNYCGCVENRSAILIIKGRQLDFKTFKPLQWLKRDEVIFKGHSNHNRRVVRKKLMSISSQKILPSIFEPQNRIDSSSPRTQRNKLRRLSTDLIGSY